MDLGNEFCHCRDNLKWSCCEDHAEQYVTCVECGLKLDMTLHCFECLDIYEAVLPETPENKADIKFRREAMGLDTSTPSAPASGLPVMPALQTDIHEISEFTGIQNGRERYGLRRPKNKWGMRAPCSRCHRPGKSVGTFALPPKEGEAVSRKPFCKVCLLIVINEAFSDDE